MRIISPPVQAINYLVELLGQPQQRIDEISNKLASIPASSRIGDFIDERFADEDWTIIAVLMMLFRHHLSLTDQPLTTGPYLSQIIEQVSSNYQRHHNEAVEEGKLLALKQLLRQALSANFPLGRMMKSNDLQTFNERNFTRMRIVTDIRPVFESDDEVTEPLGAVVVHTMNVVFQKHLSGMHDEIFVGLDTEELLEMKACIDRAIAKSEILERSLKTFGARLDQ